VQYAVEVLKVKHVIGCGHYGCGGVEAAFGPPLDGALERWIHLVRRVRSAHATELGRLPDQATRLRRLCELNVMAQVERVCRLPAVRDAWRRRQELAVHGWIYDLPHRLLPHLPSHL